MDQGWIALDIETSGLDPRNNHVLAVGLFSPGREKKVFMDQPEKRLLTELEDFIAALPSRTVVVTWNGEEFDLPFLAARFSVCGVKTSLRVVPKAETGKYGGRLYKADWGKHPHLDIAPHFREAAAAQGVPWSLKPVARSILGVEPIEEDRRGDAISLLSKTRLKRYVMSDARMTSELTERLMQTGAVS